MGPPAANAVPVPSGRERLHHHVPGTILKRGIPYCGVASCSPRKEPSRSTRTAQYEDYRPGTLTEGALAVNRALPEPDGEMDYLVGEWAEIRPSAGTLPSANTPTPFERHQQHDQDSAVPRV
ncbi:hypothetical protein PTTG_28299 [Puccinia triticina 1-1 BBBD Race 1]|uniref:Uncharacterized protein n=1 Tax=Puccinia triticina (isolate 1-1 / race 1 (BBBD)) TaxID=630390 RepID=A0A180GCV7_PUCT1|nr:hypothetical protein PTTG_28299 [Puccinia triticina 1-1 BBBD Race 1]